MTNEQLRQATSSHAHEDNDIKRQVYRGIADAQLEATFGAEYIRLDRTSHSVVLTDYVDAAISDSDCTCAEYLRRIGAGNLASYAQTLLAGS